MTDGNRVEFVGAGAAADDLRRWADQLGPAVAKGASDFGDDIAGRVRSKVPRLTGRLAASVESTPTDDGVEVALGGGVEYAGWIEFGGSRGRPYVSEGRYLYPTALAATDEWVDDAESTAIDTIRRYPWSNPS